MRIIVMVIVVVVVILPNIVDLLLADLIATLTGMREAVKDSHRAHMSEKCGTISDTAQTLPGALESCGNVYGAGALC